MKRHSIGLSVGSALLLTGCVYLPTAPMVTVLPGTGKAFDQFHADDASCRNYAYSTVAGPSQTTANAAVYGYSYYELQRQYDSAYIQCMYSNGNRVPARVYSRAYSEPSYSTPAPSSDVPPDYVPTPNPRTPPPDTPPPRGVS